ncbi:unnamed protein product [Allacma fusca]|uniref:Uncharacterized protein n=1 Tax=Allacma fusca TaxID=39272 RepID=A0A8J2LA65_9HEXA|nr:unnamed protein product [Allacma fusca]
MIRNGAPIEHVSLVGNPTEEHTSFWGQVIFVNYLPSREACLVIINRPLEEILIELGISIILGINNGI